jgi:Pentapeptide repeats (9 copies)
VSVYLIRTGSETLTPNLDGAEDCLFVDQRFDGQTLPEGLYVRCTFANVSFLRATLERVRFSACVFEACYFRETTFNTCRFSGTRFIDCDFVKPNILGCDFSYARFSGCFPPAEEIESSLPAQHNMREALTSNLASEAEQAGDGTEAREYLLKAIQAREQHLLAGARAHTQYYRDHFPNSLDRIGAFWRYLLSRLNGYLWGHGERGWPLLRSLIGVAFIAWPVLFLLARGSIDKGGGHVSYGDCVWLSLGSMLSNSGATGLTTTGFARALVLTEGAIGLLVLGLFVTYVFRYVTRR